MAFGAGVLTVASPCVLPVLPVVLGATAAGGPGARPLFIAAGFAGSFTLLALVFGALQSLLGLQQQTVRDVAALLLVAFGLSMVWPALFQRLSGAAGGWLNRVSQLGARAGPGWVGGLLVGVSLGAVWAGLLGLFALGAALPMLGIAYGGQWLLAHLRGLARHSHRLQQGLGLVVASVGALTFFQLDTLVTLWLADFYPALAGGL
ncbi:MAG: cytochrome C biogenesis protein [Burkholderiales bacterium PBB5]|nr:MAG: cytochrome C biogenesis protein [Burkholderiales bacterium PBB5]